MATDGEHVNGQGRFCHVVRWLFACRRFLGRQTATSTSKTGHARHRAKCTSPKCQHCKLQSKGSAKQSQAIDFIENKHWHGICNIFSKKSPTWTPHHQLAEQPAENMTMNSALLLALNTVALAALVMFHFQSGTSDDVAQLRQPVPHHLQQRPQLAVMTANAQTPLRVTQDAQSAPASEHWIF